MVADTYAKARVAQEPPGTIIRNWLAAGWADIKAHTLTSVFYGGTLAVLGWLVIWLLMANGWGWMLLPALAGGVLIGPLVSFGLYSIARGKKAEASAGQIILVGTILMIFALTWIRAATVLFAIFYGLKPFAGPLDVITQMFTTPSGWLLLIVGSLVGGLFAALGFAISAFSLPLLADRNIDGFSAMALSFNATTQNFALAVTWGAVVTALTLIGIATGLVGFVIIFPLLGFATWHAYEDLFKGGMRNETPDFPITQTEINGASAD